jgi:peptidoglycan/LPS O-acetylase OafA/YrhL
MLLAWNVLPRLFQRALGIAAFISTLVITMYLTGHNRGAVLSSGFTIYGLAVAIVLISLVREPPRLALRLLECRPLVWLGEISYAVYLWHFFAITLAMRWIDSPAMVSLMAMAFTLAFASLSYYLIEKPFLRLKKRFQKVGEQSSQLDQRLGHNLGDYAIPS